MCWHERDSQVEKTQTEAARKEALKQAKAKEKQELKQREAAGKAAKKQAEKDEKRQTAKAKLLGSLHAESAGGAVEPNSKRRRKSTS